MDLFWVMEGGGGQWWALVSLFLWWWWVGGQYFSGGGGWWCLFFGCGEWWWVMVGIFWVVVGGGGWRWVLARFIIAHLRHLNCKESKPCKCFNIKISYSFLYTRKFREDYFPKEYLFARKKQLPGPFISWEVTTGELHLRWHRNYFQEEWNKLQEKGTPRVGIRLQILFIKNMKTLIKLWLCRFALKLPKRNLTIN